MTTPKRTAAPSAIALISALLAISVVDARAQTPLTPFSADFEIVYRGMNAGSTTLELTAEGGERWRYVT